MVRVTPSAGGASCCFWMVSRELNFRINNTTDVLLLNTVVFTGAPATSTSYTVTGLTQSIAANDEITIKWQTPTWATNPTGAQLVITLFFERT